ncbi:cation channel sperm-associated protein subunit delta-domain-containing protein [Entophlyctis helioformis]|nr:cation channel sperm-associated protein subunit delta-domain-containing protein [Entophlyctis helioformis]
MRVGNTVCLSMVLFLQLLLPAAAVASPHIERRAANVFGNNRFYYESLESDKTSFVAGRAFRAAFTSTATQVTWANPSLNCVLSDGSSSSTGTLTVAQSATLSITCTTAGVETFTVLRDGNAATTDTFSVTIVAGQCFQWYYVVGPSPLDSQPSSSLGFAPASTASVAMRVWVADPASLSAGETAGTAVTPSAKSAQLSAAFYSVGEWPMVTISGGGAIITNVSIGSTGSYWDVTLQTYLAGSYPTTITSLNTTLLNCAIRDTHSAIAVTKFSAATLGLNTHASAGSSASSYFSVVQDSCAPNVVLAIGSAYGDGRFAMSQTMFAAADSSLLYSLPSALSPGTSLRGFAFPHGGISALVTNSAVFANTSSPLSASSGLPASTQLARIQSVSYCDASINRTSALNTLVVAWDPAARSTPSATNITLYLSTDAGATFFSTVSVNVDKTAVGNGYIRDVAIIHTFATISILVRDGSGFDRIALLDTRTWTVTTDAYEFRTAVNPDVIVDGGVKGSTPRLTPVASGAGELLVWGDGLFYSPNGGLNVFPVSLVSRDPARPAAGLDTSEYITQVATAVNGRFAALTSTNRIFYGQTGLSTAIELVGGLATTALASILFDQFSRLIVLTPRTTAPFVDKRVIPAENQVSSPRVPSSANPPLACPYSSWTTNLSSEYILDAGQSLLFMSSIVPASPHLSESISISLSNTSLINSVTTNRETSKVGSNGVYNVRLSSVVIKPKSLSHQGRLEVKVHPNNDSMACASTPKVTVVRVGCPPNRRLVLRSPATQTVYASPTPRYFWGTRYVTLAPLSYATNSASSSSYGSSDDDDDSHGSSYSVYHGYAYQSITYSTSKPTPTYPASRNCAQAPAEVTVPANDWISDWSSGARGSSDKVVPYNCTQYGTPLPVFYGDAFVPTFDIFDGTVYVDTPNVDIAFWEVHGRSSYTFNTTMSHAGCRTKAVSWRSLASQMPNDPINALSTSNYVKCYDPSLTSTLGSENQYAPYEITNRTNFNAILWTGGRGGHYIFRARVVDPTYSYCSLSADFAVVVSGQPINWGIQLSIVLTITAVGFGALWLSYDTYARRQKAEREEETRNAAAAASATSATSAAGDPAGGINGASAARLPKDKDE